MDGEIEDSIKLAVHVAETGHYFELNCPTSTPVHVLQTCIASAVHVNPQDQLLLCGHMRLEPQRTLASYRLSSEKWNVFLFNRSRLLGDSSPPAPENVPVKELVLPPSPHTSLRSHPLSDLVDPAVHMLPSYETQFSYHFQKGSTFFACSRDKFETCRRLYREQQVQVLAMDAAKSNMNHFFEMIQQSNAEFLKRFYAQHKQHAGSLINFDRDLERLRACKLHPSLISEKRTSLLECLDEARLRKQMEACASSHKQLQTKVMQSNALHAELDCSIQDLLNITPTVDLQRLGQLITENSRMMEEQQVILQSLRKDVDTVKKLVNSLGSLQPHDAIAALGPMYDVHEKNQLPKIETYHQRLEKLLSFFRAKKNEMSVCLHTFMQRVAALQSSIRDMRNQLSAFNEAMNQEDDLFSDLKLVCKVGPCYKACLAEVVRRKASMKLYMGQAGQMAERMAKKRADEAVRRDEFLRAQCAILPRDLLVSMGLFSNPSQCIVNIEPYDTNLIDFHIEELERYAPETLCGPYLKASVTSNTLENDHLSTSLEEAFNANPNIEALDEMSAEIAGTSKLEVENAWLKAEYASAIALLCSIDSDFGSLAFSDRDEAQLSNEALVAKRTMEALALKDDHAKHLRSMLSASQMQCSAYEKRVRELEKRLSDHYSELHGLASDRCTACSQNTEVSGLTGEGRIPNPDCPFEPMDECTSDRKPAVTVKNNRVEPTLGGDDEAMVETCGGSTRDVVCEVQHEGINSGQMQLPTGLEREVRSCFAESEVTKAEELVALQEAVLQAGNRCTAVEKRLEVALEESAVLKEELQKKTALLNECYMNCAGLEGNLLLARDEARTNQCLATRKAAEYNSLRASSVKLRGLVERLRHCVFSSQTGLLQSLQAFADSLDRQGSRDDVTEEFSRCVHILAERVGQLAQKECRLVQSSGCVSNSVLAAELKSKMDFLKDQYERQRLHKQR
ncbi:hypothetical protein GOP47_0002885 [Adiantum capillus-veneris]|uniref:Autophagy protein ATG17-like domain-containing protein n=1 Tax=Adiantum capillus-veneris TaxID=13818 RepID=A0A9D4VCX2_ADICA|nr:hypothetical protein GOP47_0002885 [Adiantum capillus-veneris]